MAVKTKSNQKPWQTTGSVGTALCLEFSGVTRHKISLEDHLNVSQKLVNFNFLIMQTLKTDSMY